MEQIYKITEAELAQALAAWEAEAAEQNWPSRDDDQRHPHTADYLLRKMGVKG